MQLKANQISRLAGEVCSCLQKANRRQVVHPHQSDEGDEGDKGALWIIDWTPIIAGASGASLLLTRFIGFIRDSLC